MKDVRDQRRIDTAGEEKSLSPGIRSGKGIPKSFDRFDQHAFGFGFKIVLRQPFWIGPVRAPLNGLFVQDRSRQIARQNAARKKLPDATVKRIASGRVVEHEIFGYPLPVWFTGHPREPKEGREVPVEGESLGRSAIIKRLQPLWPPGDGPGIRITVQKGEGKRTVDPFEKIRSVASRSFEDDFLIRRVRGKPEFPAKVLPVVDVAVPLEQPAVFFDRTAPSGGFVKKVTDIGVSVHGAEFRPIRFSVFLDNSVNQRHGCSFSISIRECGAATDYAADSFSARTKAASIASNPASRSSRGIFSGGSRRRTFRWSPPERRITPLSKHRRTIFRTLSG